MKELNLKLNEFEIKLINNACKNYKLEFEDLFVSLDALYHYNNIIIFDLNNNYYGGTNTLSPVGIRKIKKREIKDIIDFVNISTALPKNFGKSNLCQEITPKLYK